MELTYLFVVHLLAVLSVRAPLARGNEELNITEEAITEEQQKVHDECRNPDYKKYVKCLMRPKRQYHGDGIHEDSTHCLEACLKKCEHHVEHDCEKKCNHCTKRTRHRHQIITEYETECVSGNCGPAESNGGNGGNGGLKTTNITTNIDIHNIINTCTALGGTCPGGKCVNGTCIPTEPVRRTEGGGGGRGGGGEGGRGGGGGEGGRGEGGGGFETPSLPIIPQISLVPQITYAYTGCVFSQWLCAQVVQQPALPDCSGCGNPLLRYKCDIKCYAINANATNNN